MYGVRHSSPRYSSMSGAPFVAYVWHEPQNFSPPRQALGPSFFTSPWCRALNRCATAYLSCSPTARGGRGSVLVRAAWRSGRQEGVEERGERSRPVEGAFELPLPQGEWRFGSASTALSRRNRR